VKSSRRFAILLEFSVEMFRTGDCIFSENVGEAIGEFVGNDCSVDEGALGERARVSAKGDLDEN